MPTLTTPITTSIWRSRSNTFPKIKIFRIINPKNNLTIDEIIQKIKVALLTKYPIYVGTEVFKSSKQQWNQYNNGKRSNASIFGYFLPPNEMDSVVGGHAMCIVGWNDDLEMTSQDKIITTKGAFILLNSWGIDSKIGKNGMVYIPYSYVSNSDIVNESLFTLEI